MEQQQHKKTVSRLDLKAGDILAEDIGMYSELQAGTMVTQATIDTINKIPGIREVAIVDTMPMGLHDESPFEPEPEHADDAGGSTDAIERYLREKEAIVARNEAHADSISSRIEQALTKRTLVTQENVEQESEQRNIDLDSMDRVDRNEVIGIINEVSRASAQLDELEQKPKMEKQPLYQALLAKARAVDNVYMGLLNARQQAVQMLEEIVMGFIDETGPNRDASLLLKDVVNQTDTFLANHCMNVAVVSVATAIELTRLMEDKLNDPKLQKDMNLMQRIKKKVFSVEELVKLGFAAFVHDIYFKKAFPRLRHDDVLKDLTSRSHVEKHPAESYHLMRRFEMDYHVNKAVLQHHERVDGSGYPDGITSRTFSKYTPIVAFADRYVSLTQPNPFAPHVHPTAALKHLLTRERAGFDNDTMIAFAKASTMVPIGSWVLMENGLVGYASQRVSEASLPLIYGVMKENGDASIMPQHYDPNEPGNRITRLLKQEQMKEINPSYTSLYVG